MLTYKMKCVIMGKEVCRCNGGRPWQYCKRRLLVNYNQTLMILTAAHVF